jgi:hypothetical protein
MRRSGSATVHAFAVRARVLPVTASTADPAAAAALSARERRGEPRAIAEEDPQRSLASWASGAPDQSRQSDDGGLVDANSVHAQVLVDRLGLSQEEAGWVVDTHERLGRFSIPAELEVYAELPALTVEAVAIGCCSSAGSSSPSLSGQGRRVARRRSSR